MTKIYKAKKWWSLLPEETKAEIFENNYGVNSGSNNWNQWWHLIVSDKEKIQIYEDFNFPPKGGN
jgi:hypothetical protein